MARFVARSLAGIRARQSICNHPAARIPRKLSETACGAELARYTHNILVVRVPETAAVAASFVNSFRASSLLVGGGPLTSPGPIVIPSTKLLAVQKDTNRFAKRKIIHMIPA